MTRAGHLLAFATLTVMMPAVLAQSSTMTDAALGMSKRPADAGFTALLDLESSIAVGDTLPETVTLRPVPHYETYRYATVNYHRVIVDATTRKAVYIVD